ISGQSSILFNAIRNINLLTPIILSIFAKHCLRPSALIFIILLGISCSKSDDQRRFEEEALRPPQHITETNAAGDTTGTVDKDDWRIGPMFQGRISIGTLGES